MGAIQQDPPAQVGSGLLIERDWELNAIEQSLVSAQRGHGSVVFVEGPAGSGKSALLSAAADLAHRHGVQVLTAAATELESEFGFGVALQLLEPVWLRAAAGERDALISGSARPAAALLAGAPPLPADLSGDRRYPLIHALYWVIRNLAGLRSGPGGPRGIAVLLDELQWADAASARLLAYAAQRIRDLPMVIVTAATSGAAALRSEPLQALRRCDRGVPLTPAPLSVGGTAEMVARRLLKAGPELRDAVAVATGGNPFLIEALMDEARQQELPSTVPAEVIGALVPETVIDGVRRRLDAMPTATRAAAVGTAVLGRDATIADLARFAGVDGARVLQVIDALTASGLLRAGEAPAYAQPLLRSAVLAALPNAELGQAHATAALILSDRGADPGRVASHLLATTPASDPRITELMRECAPALLAGGDVGLAIALLGRALLDHPGPELRAQLLTELGLAEAAAGMSNAGQRLVEARRLTQDPKRHAEITLALAHTAVRDSIRGVPAAQVSDRVRLAWGDGVLPESVGPDDPTIPLLVISLLVCDDLDAVDAFCHQVAATPAGVDTWLARGLRPLRAWSLYLRGRITEAEAEARASAELDRGHWAAQRAAALSVIACCHIHRGDLGPAEAALRSLAEQAAAHEIVTPAQLTIQGELRLAQHRPQEALDDALAAGAAWQAIFPAASPATLPWRSTATAAHLALGQASAARKLIDAELQDARRIGLTRGVIRGLRLQGLAVGGSQGLSALSEAVALGDASGARLEHIRALVDLGAALRRANQRVAARAPLSRALDLSNRGGAGALAARAHTELRAAGARPRRLAMSGIDSLTVSQRRVAELAARGLTTRQIAEGLFVSPKTVEFHLRQAYQKLDIASRSELAALFAT
jgi:DNA-binding CsgD family transcriptional regulator